ncbi:MAG: YqhA family protein [Meiothermus sp.]|nr:YqhA family protein [Meiothermus sp.]
MEPNDSGNEARGRRSGGLPNRGEANFDERTASFIDNQMVGVMRFLAVLGVISSSLLAVALFVAAIARTVIDIWANLGLFGTKEAVKQLLISGIEQADVLLVAVALLIVGFGLYTLFIGTPTNAPRWLKITSLSELKSKLTDVIVVAIFVKFFSQAVYGTENMQDLLMRGAASGLMIVAVAIFGMTHSGRGDQKSPD